MIFLVIARLIVTSHISLCAFKSSCFLLSSRLNWCFWSRNPRNRLEKCFSFGAWQRGWARFQYWNSSGDQVAGGGEEEEKRKNTWNVLFRVFSLLGASRSTGAYFGLTAKHHTPHGISITWSHGETGANNKNSATNCSCSQKRKRNKKKEKRPHGEAEDVGCKQDRLLINFI